MPLGAGSSIPALPERGGTSEGIRSPTVEGPGVPPSLGPREPLWGPRASGTLSTLLRSSLPSRVPFALQGLIHLDGSCRCEMGGRLLQGEKTIQLGEAPAGFQ